MEEIVRYRGELVPIGKAVERIMARYRARDPVACEGEANRDEAHTDGGNVHLEEAQRDFAREAHNGSYREHSRSRSVVSDQNEVRCRANGNAIDHVQIGFENPSHTKAPR